MVFRLLLSTPEVVLPRYVLGIFVMLNFKSDASTVLGTLDPGILISVHYQYRSGRSTRPYSFIYSLSHHEQSIEADKHLFPLPGCEYHTLLME